MLDLFLFAESLLPFLAVFRFRIVGLSQCKVILFSFLYLAFQKGLAKSASVIREERPVILSSSSHTDFLPPQIKSWCKFRATSDVVCMCVSFSLSSLRGNLGLDHLSGMGRGVDIRNVWPFLQQRSAHLQIAVCFWHSFSNTDYSISGTKLMQHPITTDYFKLLSQDCFKALNRKWGGVQSQQRPYLHFGSKLEQVLYLNSNAEIFRRCRGVERCPCTSAQWRVCAEHLLDIQKVPNISS